MTGVPVTPSFRLDGRHALVTGGTSGIGRGAAAALAAAGADVTVAARSPDGLADARAAFAEAGLAIRTLQLDVTDTSATAAAIAARGPFEVLVNSAGIARHAPALEVTTGQYEQVMDVNVKAAFFQAQAVAKGLIEAGRPGSLITLSSQMGHVGGIERSVYCATKHAVEGFTKAMAIEWGRYGIRVNTLCPTFVRTPFTERTLADPERLAWVEGKIRLGRVGEVEDIMGAVVYLASDASALVTGTAMMVDGGWTAG